VLGDQVWPAGNWGWVTFFAVMKDSLNRAGIRHQVGVMGWKRGRGRRHGLQTDGRMKKPEGKHGCWEPAWIRQVLQVPLVRAAAEAWQHARGEKKHVAKRGSR